MRVKLKHMRKAELSGGMDILQLSVTEMVQTYSVTIWYNVSSGKNRKKSVKVWELAYKITGKAL